MICGGIDYLWINPSGELIIVDYKATAKNSEVNLDAEWQDGYRRQAEISQWLFAMNGYKVSPMAYFVYCNGRCDWEASDRKLEFEVKLIPYVGNYEWVGPAINTLYACMKAETIPPAAKDCDLCWYRAVASEYN